MNDKKQSFGERPWICFFHLVAQFSGFREGQIGSLKNLTASPIIIYNAVLALTAFLYFLENTIAICRRPIL